MTTVKEPSVKGAPDVVVERCGRALWHGEQVPITTAREEILAANRQLSERGLRVLAFAARDLDDAAMSAAMADPMTAVNMTMAFAIVSLSAVNIGLIMRRERQAPWASPVFPYLGWIILGWILTWAAVELHMLQRLLDTTSLTGGQWGTVLALSLIAPAIVGADKAIQLQRQRKAPASASAEREAEPVV